LRKKTNNLDPFLRKKAIVLLILSIILPLIIVLFSLKSYRLLFSSVKITAKLDEKKKADAIIIFGAAISYKGRPSAVLKSRIMHALKLHKQGYAGFFILTGGVGWGPPAESVVMQRELNKHGIKNGKIFLEKKSTRTRQQVSFAIKLMERNKFTSAILVSDPIHMYRLKQYFRKSGLTVYASPARSITYSKKQQTAYIQMELLKLLAFYIFDI